LRLELKPYEDRVVAVTNLMGHFQLDPAN